MKINKEKAAGELSWGNLKKVVVGSSTNLTFYRDLIRKPPGQAFKYLAFLAAVVAIALGGREINALHHYLNRMGDILRGNLPPLRIEKGRVEMEGETFSLEEENSFPVRFLEERIKLDREASGGAKSEAARWLKEIFRDPEDKLTGSDVMSEINSHASEMEPEVAGLIERNADFGSFIFQVDLSGEVPSFSPGAEGFILTPQTVYFRIGPAPSINFSLKNVKSVVINDDALNRWRKVAIWALAPLLILFNFARYFLAKLLQILFGCLVAGVTVLVIKCRISFRQVFILSLYALTPVVILGLVVDLSGVNIIYFPVVYLLVYAVYVVGATKNCCRSS